MPAPHKKPLKELFEERYRVTPGCWIWEKGRTAAGYGQFVYHTKKMYAHRLSYELYNGPIPEGLCVLHKCDNPACVNPDHLSIGTHLDNMRDMDKKGRRQTVATCGEDSKSAKLTALDVFGIRNATGTQREIAKRFGVHQRTVWRILHGQTWKDVE